MKSQPQQHHLPQLLQQAGLRPTRQRMALALVALFDGCPKHMTAEQVHAAVRLATAPKVSPSATVCQCPAQLYRGGFAAQKW